MNKKYVAVLKGAAAELVMHREQRGHTVTDPSKYKKRKKFSEAYYKSRTTDGYKTNRSIKTWATFFLLKSLTTSGHISNWTQQKEELLNYCKITENCFRSRLQELKQLKLITISKNRSIQLTSFETAAEILGIEYTGTIKIEYNDQQPGQQIFQYYLVLDEVRCNQQSQLDALNYKADKNPQLKNVLQSVMMQHGADGTRLNEKKYFQEYLLKIQLHFFKTGSDIFSVISQLRAEINRSVQGIKRQYGYRSAQSVSYLKNRLKEIGIAAIEKNKMESDVRERLYVPGPGNTKIEANRYCLKTKRTVLFCCDAIQSKIQIHETKKKTKATAKAA